MANIERLKELREYLRANPEKHRQQSWATRPADTVLVEGSCGTTACMAGTACIQAGFPLDWETADHYETINGVVHLTANRVKDGRYIEDVAREYLELDADEASGLFMTMDTAYALELLDELIEYGYLEF